jgi:DNA-binding transcriptional ArsR family regulator
VVRFVFGVEGLAHTRFAISPLLELNHALLALRDPSSAALHVPWITSLSGRLDGIELERAVVLTPPHGYTPDFLVPPPRGPFGDLEEGLAALRATPVRQVRADMRLFGSQHPRARATVEAWLAHPRRELGRLADVFEAFWARALAPVWPRVRAFLDADVAYRSRRLAAAGPAGLFSDLAGGVAWRDGAVEVAVPRHDATLPLDARGLLLVPSAFEATRPFVIDRAPWQPTLIYPARGIATLWDEAPVAPGSLARLLGASRAAILSDLGAPRSTQELARRLSLSPATASHHLGALRDTGLVTSRRDGRAVLYVRTALGDGLAAGGAERLGA